MNKIYIQLLTWQAQLHMRSGNLPMARNLFQQICQADRDNPDAWMLLNALGGELDDPKCWHQSPSCENGGSGNTLGRGAFRSHTPPCYKYYSENTHPSETVNHLLMSNKHNNILIRSKIRKAEAFLKKTIYPLPHGYSSMYARLTAAA